VPVPREELADFLRRARAGVDPRTTRLPVDARLRRVPGLRREEVALLAGVSTDYYTRLEQGRRITPSSGVLDAIARALGLDAAGRAHLENLVRAGTGVRRATAAPRPLRAGASRLVEVLDQQPVLLLGPLSDVVGGNRMAAALLTDFARRPAPDRNYTRWLLLSAAARELFVDWEAHARAAVESLRLDVGHLHDDASHAMVARLQAESPEFHRWWKEHRVHERSSGPVRLRHPRVGPLTVDCEVLAFQAEPDVRLLVYTTEAGTPSRRALEALAARTASDATT
jgi:transcriptional regulator with XRE-family HTH domain